MLHEILKMLLEEKIILKGFTFTDSFFSFALIYTRVSLQIFSNPNERISKIFSK